MTPVPLSLCHLDGTPNKTDKSVLAKLLERTVLQHGEPVAPDVIIIDGFFYLHQLKQLPQKFGQLSLKILHGVTMVHNYKKIFIVFDRYITPSIKDNEHILRQNYDRDFVIKGKVYYLNYYYCYYFYYNVLYQSTDKRNLILFYLTNVESWVSCTSRCTLPTHHDRYAFNICGLMFYRLCDN